MTEVQPCPLPAESHMGWGSARDLSPFDPHAHPFGPTKGLVACCLKGAECRVAGHLSLTDAGLQHVEVSDG